MAEPSLPQLEIDTILSTPILTLPNGISIRPYRTTDAAAIAHHANNHSLWLNMTDMFPHPYTLDAADNWIAMQLDPLQTWQSTSLPGFSPSTTTLTTLPIKLPRNYVIALDDNAIGTIGLVFKSDVECRTIELGYWVGTEHHGKGIASIAARAFLDWTFENFPYVVRACAKIYHWNKASMRVAEKSGMERESVMKAAVWKAGRLGDIVCYVRVRGGYGILKMAR